MSHEQSLTADLIARLADRFGPASRVAKELPGWLEYIVEVECPERPAKRPGKTWWDKVRALAHSLVPDVPDEDTVQRNTAMLGDHFGLSSVETQVLTFLALYQSYGSFEHVVDSALDTKEASFGLILSFFCDAPEREIRAAIQPSGRLVCSGMIKRERWGRARLPFALNERLTMVLTSEVSDVSEMVALLFPAAPAPDAEWQDFDGISGDAALMRDLMVRALAEGLPGVNLLLYGPPGTGKTEFAKVLAHEIGTELRAVGETDTDGGEPSRGERVADLVVAGRLLAGRTDTVLLFDEMEDLSRPDFGLRGSSASKVHFNRMLESNPIPVIWTTNSVESCDPAFLRRMSYSVLMRPLSGQVRGRIWQRLSDRHGVALEPAVLSDMAKKHDLAPALVSDAMRVTRLCDGGADMVGQVLHAATRLAKGGVDLAPRHHGEAPWQPDLARTDTDLRRVEARLSGSDAPRRISFCLEGAAGTGKSAWARHLARQMGLPVIEKRASDLMSMWVGGSEKNIARAFAEARAEGAMLIFDEADSLLADRRGALRNWEVSQVNEMLTWMESHPLPFVCTTNFVERLDPATQRRFTFRIRFDWLSPVQLPLAWAAYFTGLPPAGLDVLDRLAPGDFANVSRRMHALGETNPAAIMAELNREVEAKDGATRPIGFGR